MKHSYSLSILLNEVIFLQGINNASYSRGGGGTGQISRADEKAFSPNSLSVSYVAFHFST